MKKVNLPSNIKDLIECKENNKIIALSILYVPYNTEEIRHAYNSKYNKGWKTSNSLNDYRWKKMALSCNKKLLAFFRGVKPKHVGAWKAS